jgi:oxygen-dependent protoporphyrinogen oxidase
MNASSARSNVAVLGAGITGLTAAWHLRRAGYAPVVFDKAVSVGGAIGETTRNGWLHELGPNSLLENSREVSEFIDDIGLAARKLYASPAAKQRFIVRGGQLVAMPMSPWSFVTTSLFSFAAKMRLLGEPWRPRRAFGSEESVSAFVLRRLGREFLDYAIDPFVGGVYAGDPARLSVPHAFPKLHALEQEHGSLIRGALKRRNTTGGPKGRIFSFPNGLGEIPIALARRLGDSVRLGARVKGLRRTAAGWEVAWESDGASCRGLFASVVVALPADVLATLPIEGIADADSLRILREIEQPPVASVFTGFKRTDIRHSLDGFGALVPTIERRRILGTLFSSTLFPGRAPEGHVALTTFVGGTRSPDLLALDDAALLQVVQGELADLVGASAPPAYTHVQRWPRAIPQYVLGYQRFKDAMRKMEASAPGLYIGGNCRDGISLSNCIASGRRLATCVAEMETP